MAVAEERKQVETLQAQASEYRQHQEKALGATLDRLNAFVQFMESQVGLPPPIELAQHDAASFLAQKQLYEDRKGQLTKAHEAIGNVTQETQRQRQAWIAKQAGDTEKALRDTLPGFDDNTINDLASYLDKVGINPQTADVAFVQKGVWELAQKAKAYDAILADKAKLKPVAQLAKVQKPSASNQPNRTQQGKSEAFKRYESKPTLANLAALL
jgi:predicted DNA-binding helix-hairpin-helix protein